MKILYKPHQYNQQRQREKARFIYPVRLAMEAEYYRQNGNTVYWGSDDCSIEYYRECDLVIRNPEGIDFRKLPQPDRVFTKAYDKRYQNNGNFKHKPGTYMMAASGCWHGKCEFCVERGKEYIVRKVENVVDEVKECFMEGFKEVFDDSATFPGGLWLYNFCKLMIRDKVPMTLGCNMRLVPEQFDMMAAAGFRMVLFGVESANQRTLDKINKGISVDNFKVIKQARKAGLEPHLAVMFGYPWETDREAENTLKFVHRCLRKGYARTAQASFYTVDGVKSNEEHKKYIPKIYKVGYSPEFWFNQLRFIKDVDDIKYIWRGIKEALNNG